MAKDKLLSRQESQIEETRIVYDLVEREASLQRSQRLNQGELTEYNYYQKIETPLTQSLPSDAVEITEQAQPIEKKESHSQKKQREGREQKTRKAAEKTRKADQLEGSQKVVDGRQRRAQAVEQQLETLSTLDWKERQQEEKILSARLEAIKLSESAALENAKADGVLSQENTLEISWQAMNDRVAALSSFIVQLPIESGARRTALEKKEALQVQANDLRQQLRVMRIQDPVERKRETDTLSRHKRYDFFKPLFRRTPPFLSREEAVYTHGKDTYVNKGRAFFGGTKFMYILENRKETVSRQNPQTGQQEETAQQYLFKEATNCLGMDKPEGALVTEAASKLQRHLCGEAFSIPAWAVRDKDGKVVGSMQKKMEKTPSDVNLFSWQAHPENTLPENTKDDLLREHALDWMLCNFDTKGENFLMQEEDRLISFDKEASFNHLMDDGAKGMSITYKPHANDTIYNTLFTAFTKGVLTLDLKETLTQVEKMESLADEVFMDMFQETLTARYGKDAENLAEAKKRLLERKHFLREEYTSFYTTLIEERKKNMAGRTDPQSYDQILDPDGKFRFPSRRG